jgi:hypothetical protein
LHFNLSDERIVSKLSKYSDKLENDHKI